MGRTKGMLSVNSCFGVIRRQDFRRLGIHRLCLGRLSQFSGPMCEHQDSLGDMCGNAKVNVKSTWLITELCGRKVEP